MQDDSTPNDNLIPYGFCHCGCGEKTAICTHTKTKQGLTKGEPMKFISGHNQRGKAGHWRGVTGEAHPAYANRGRSPWNKGKTTGLVPWNKGRVSEEPAWNKGLISPENRLASLGVITEERKRRFFDKVAMPTTPDGCWVWTAAKQHGYGVFGTYRSKTQLAHRFSYVLHGGDIPDGWHVHHICDNPACVNPDHLEPIAPDDHARLHHKRGTFPQSRHKSDAA